VDNLYTAIEELLKQKYPGVTTTRLTGAFEVRDDEASDWALEVDTFIYAVGD
jgi:hypothetical protein